MQPIWYSSVKKWASWVPERPSTSDRRILRLNVESISEIDRRNLQRKYWGFYVRYLNNNIAHVILGTDIRNKLGLTIMGKHRNKAVIEAFMFSCPIKADISLWDVSSWNRILAKIWTEIRKLFNQTNQTRVLSKHKTPWWRKVTQSGKQTEKTSGNIVEELNKQKHRAHICKVVAMGRETFSTRLRNEDFDLSRMRRIGYIYFVKLISFLILEVGSNDLTAHNS